MEITNPRFPVGPVFGFYSSLLPAASTLLRTTSASLLSAPSGALTLRQALVLLTGLCGDAWDVIC